MPPARKCRFVFSEPQCTGFLPKTGEGGASCACVEISVEALEAVRLCDLAHFDQTEAAGKMGISRGTFQRILYAAREKIAFALVNGAEIKIGGGEYRVIKKKRAGCAANRCARCAFRREDGTPCEKCRQKNTAPADS